MWVSDYLCIDCNHFIQCRPAHTLFCSQIVLLTDCFAVTHCFALRLFCSQIVLLTHCFAHTLFCSHSLTACYCSCSMCDSGAVVQLYKGAEGSVRSVCCHTTEPVVAACGLDRFVRVYDIETRHLLHKVRYSLSSILCVFQCFVAADWLTKR